MGVVGVVVNPVSCTAGGLLTVPEPSYEKHQTNEEVPHPVLMLRSGQTKDCFP